MIDLFYVFKFWKWDLTSSNNVSLSILPWKSGLANSQQQPN